MTKRALYAQLTAALLLISVPGELGAQSSGAPCGSCLGITIGAGQQLLLPDDLSGLTILVRVSAEGGSPFPAGAFTDIASRGGQPALLVEPSVTSPVPADFSYRLKSFLTQSRAQAGAEVLIALRADGLSRSLLDELHPYVDVLVGTLPTERDPRETPETVRLWPVIHNGTLEERLQAAQRSGYEKEVIEAPADALAARRMIADAAHYVRRQRDGVFEDVEVSARRRLSVDEIIARHQATARRQRAAVERTIAFGTFTLTFEAPGFPAPVTVTADTAMYSDRDRTEVAQRQIRINGLAFTGRGVPRLPLLEPERVASPPLEIALTARYRYRLAGEELAHGVRCYVVAFDPLEGSQSLFRGRAWIATDSFAMVKVAAVQTGLRGPIVSSEQEDDFREVRPGIWLLARSDVRQIYEGAGHRTPIHRVLTFDAHDVNPVDFAARRQAAYTSDAVLIRDTPNGYRYLRPSPPNTDASQAASPREERSVTRVRTIAAGALFDPNISRPLPFAGLSYVDFDLFGTGAQLNGFFGGAYGQLSISAPSLGGTRWQLGGRAFAIASSYNDRVFHDGREIYNENLRQRPAHASIWLLRPLTSRVSLRAGYALDYTRLQRAPETASVFVVPSSQVVHGLLLALEGQRNGWAGSIWWNPARRAGWREWGAAGDFDPRTRDFMRYGFAVSRSSAFSPRLSTRIEAQWVDGQDLDRFSRYSFGSFDNRLRGYPSALVRYDRGLVLRSALAWSVSPLVRLDGFVDTAAVRDRGFGDGLRNYTGVGLAAETPVPFGMLAAVEWGYGFRGVNADGRVGTQVIRVSAFKVF